VTHIIQAQKGNNMVQFTMSVYDTNDKCKICGAHMSEYHRDGCELGETRKELQVAARIIEQFRNLLGVETTTSAFAKLASMNRHTLHAPDGAFCSHSWAYPPEVCPACNKPVPLNPRRR
jgi:hypothetical protein